MKGCVKVTKTLPAPSTTVPKTLPRLNVITKTKQSALCGSGLHGWTVVCNPDIIKSNARAADGSYLPDCTVPAVMLGEGVVLADVEKGLRKRKKEGWREAKTPIQKNLYIYLYIFIMCFEIPLFFLNQRAHSVDVSILITPAPNPRPLLSLPICRCTVETVTHLEFSRIHRTFVAS